MRHPERDRNERTTGPMGAHHRASRQRQRCARRHRRCLGFGVRTTHCHPASRESLSLPITLASAPAPLSGDTTPSNAQASPYNGRDCVKPLRSSYPGLHRRCLGFGVRAPHCHPANRESLSLPTTLASAPAPLRLLQGSLAHKKQPFRRTLQ